MAGRTELLDPAAWTARVFTGRWTAQRQQAPFGGCEQSGGGWSIGGDADLNAYTDTQWLTISATQPMAP